MSEREYQHPLVVRVTHWLNFAALGVMVASGLRIYNASPVFDFSIPPVLTLGGWLAGARQWHFAAMWLFAINGAVWLSYNLASRHGRTTTLFRKSDVPGVIPMLRYYLRLDREHPRYGKYNSLQKLAYSAVPLFAAGAAATGIALYWPVQWSAVAALFGGYDVARVCHFLFMVALVGFFLGHISMVVLAGWSNFLSMLTGWKRQS